MKAGDLVQDALGAAKSLFSGAGHSIVAGVAGAMMLAGSMGRSIRKAAKDVRGHASKNTKHSGEVVMKKSTLIALLVALATVAGVLGALYVYVLRREKELDEYEQLLFSEDFNDDIPEDEEPDAAE